MKKFGKKLLVFALAVALFVSGTAIPTVEGSVVSYAAEVTRTAQQLQADPVSRSGAVSVSGSSGSHLFENVIAKEQEKQEQKYFVSDIEVDRKKSQAEVTFQTVSEAELIVSVYTENGQELKASAHQKVGFEDTKTVLKFTEDLPEYFIVKAFLVDVTDHAPLAQPYVSQLYTEEMQKVLSSTVDDYDSDRVVNLDSDDETNFVVYKDDVVAAKETKTDNVIEKKKDGSYVIENASEQVKNLKNGDIFSCDSQDGELVVVSVDTVKVKGDEVTLTDQGSSSLDLDDVFDAVKIESDGSNDEIAVDNSDIDENLVYEGIVDESGNTLKKKNKTQKIDVNASASRSLKYSINGDKGLSKKITGSLSFGVTANIRVYVSRAYQFASLIVEYALSPQIEVNSEVSHEFQIGKIMITTPVPGVVVFSWPSIPVSASGSMAFKGKLYGTLGGAYDSDAGIQNKCIFPKLQGSIEANVAFSTGVNANLVLTIINEKLASLKNVNALLVNVTGTDTLVTTSTVSIHDCKACLCGEVNLEFKSSLSANLTKKLKKEKTLVDAKLKLFDWYNSFTYNEFAFTKCPHIRYRMTVNVVDPDGKAVAGAVIGGTGLDKDPVTDAKGSAVFYLSPGTYALVAKATDLQGRADIYVKDEVKKIRIEMAENKDITGKLELYGDAERQADGSVHLTELETWQSGSAWYSLPINTMNGFEAAFSYYAGEGRDDSFGGADGIVLNFSSKTGIGDQGGAIGFTGEYGVELDSYPHNYGDPSGKHIAIIRESASEHIVSRLDDRVDDSAWHNVVVKYNNKTMQVYLDGSMVLERSGIKLEKEVYVGLTAATGSGKNKHYIKNFNITVNARGISVLGSSRLNAKSAAGEVNGDGYSGTIKRDNDKVTASFERLQAGKEYLIVEARNVAEEDLFDSGNLLYIDQKTADAGGKLSFTYIPKESDYSDIRLYGGVTAASSGSSNSSGNTDNSGNTNNSGNSGNSGDSGSSGNTGTSGKNLSTKKKKPSKVTAVKVKSKKKKIIVSWKKVQASGYQVQYSTNRKFKKTKAVLTGKKVKVTLKKGLKSRKTYYIRVRAFNKNGKVKKYGSFSAVKKVKVR